MAAERCGLSLEKIMDVGRWLSVTTLYKYLGSGFSQTEDAVRGSLDKKDPVTQVCHTMANKEWMFHRIFGFNGVVAVRFSCAAQR